MTYRISAFGLYFWNGLFRILPNLAIGSRPGFNSRPSLTIPVALRDTKVPSKVSRSASCRKKLRETTLTMVELSLRMRRTVVTTARGPLTKTRTASCGRYVKKNMPPITAADKLSVGTMRDANGFHRARWLRK